MREEVPEDAWVFLRRQADTSLRDGTAAQREFARRVLGTPDFAVLELPPGSGKTTANCELLAQVTRARTRVLLVASTHVAVDNVLDRLIEWQDEARETRDADLYAGAIGADAAEVVREATRITDRTRPSRRRS